MNIDKYSVTLQEDYTELAENIGKIPPLPRSGEEKVFLKNLHMLYPLWWTVLHKYIYNKYIKNRKRR